MQATAGLFIGHVEGDRLDEAEQALKGKLKVRFLRKGSSRVLPPSVFS